MKHHEYGARVTLEPVSIDRCAEAVSTFLEESGARRKELLRIRLSVEEVLLSWQEHFGTSASVRYSCYTYLGQPTVELRLAGEPFDPLNTEGPEEQEGPEVWSRRLMSELQTTPIYSYSKNTNVVTFRMVKRKLRALIYVLAAVFLGAIVGLLGYLLPAEFRTFAAEKIMTPICTTYINVLNFFGIPLIFLSIATGICGMGDASSFGRIGKRMLRHFSLTILITIAICMAAASPFFSFSYGAGSAGLNWEEFFQMVLGWLPTNLFTPFIECNAIQLILLAVVVGIAVLKLSPVSSTFSRFLEDVSGILLLISQWFTRLIPFFVFSIIVKSVWSDQAAEILSAWKSWVITVGIQLFVLLLMIVQICIAHKVSPRLIVSKLIPTFFIALGTNSCTASIPEIFSCAGTLGVHPNMQSVGIPIGTSVFKPATAIRMIVLSFFMAVANDVPVSLSWFVMVAIMAFILSVAIPAIPGGAFLFYPMLFTQLGLPAGAITAMLATDVFFDAPCTAFCMLFAELGLVQQAAKVDQLDEKVLRAPVKEA